MPVRHCCSGWDHLIVAEAALHGTLLFEGRANLMLRAMKAGGDLTQYGQRHLTPEVLAAGPQDFLNQLEWITHCVELGLTDIPAEARPLYRTLLMASMTATYIALRGLNLNIVPGAMAAFNALPEVRQIFSALRHVEQQTRALCVEA